MLAIARFTVSLSEAANFEAKLSSALEVFSGCVGFVTGEFGQNLDDTELWTLVTHWENVGSYRRALSSTSVKIGVVPLLATAIDEPGAYSREL